MVTIGDGDKGVIWTTKIMTRQQSAIEDGATMTTTTRQPGRDGRQQ